MNKNIFINERGFTLVELLIYLGIFVVLITAITLFAIIFIKATHKSQIKKEVAYSAFSAIRAMLFEIKMADAVYNPTSVFDYSPGQISLATSENPPINENSTYTDIYVDADNRLYIKKENQQPQALISEDLRVVGLSFGYLASSSESIRINLTIAYDSNNPEFQYSYTLNSSASIRK